MAQVQCYPTGHQQQSLTSPTRGRSLTPLCFLSAFNPHPTANLFKRFYFKCFQTTKLTSCHQQTSWKTHQRWQPTACICTHLKRVKGYVAKLFNVENLPATLELWTPLKVALNYVMLKALIETFQKLQAYICVPKIFSHAGHLSFSKLYSLHLLELSELFSLLANYFGDKQDNSLEDYVEASIMLRVNSAMCFTAL